MLELFRQAPQFFIGQRLALGTFHGHLLHHRFADVLGPLFHAVVPALDFLTLQHAGWYLSSDAFAASANDWELIGRPRCTS